MNTGMSIMGGSGLDQHVASLSSQQLLAMIQTGDDPVTPDPMAQSTWVYAAVNVIARTIARLSWALTRGENPDPIVNGPAYELLSAPAPGATSEDLIEEIAGHLVEGGEAHVLDPQLGVRPTQLIAVGREQMRVERDRRTGDALWWEYTPIFVGRPTRVFPEELAYIRLFNPRDPLRGLSPLDAARLGIRQDYSAAKYNDTTLRKGFLPGGIITTSMPLTEAEREEFLRRLRARHEGADNAGRVLVLGGGVSYSSTASKPIDLQLIDGRRMNREEIFSALGVPPVLGAVFDSAHYNVADAAQEIFLLNTIAPLAKKIAGLFTRLILPRIEPGLTFSFDLLSHPVMQKLERGKVDTFVRLVRNGTPYNVARDFLGLRLPDVPWGAQSFVEAGLETPDQVIAGPASLPFGELPAPQDDDEEPAEDKPAETDDGDAGDEDKEQEAAMRIHVGARAATFKAALAEERRAEERQIKAATPLFRRALRAFYAGQKQRLQRRLRSVMADADRARARAWERAAGEATPEDIAKRVLLDVVGEQAQLRKIARRAWPKALEDTLRTELRRLGLDDAEIAQALKRLKAGRVIEQLVRVKEPQLAATELTTRKRVQAQLAEGIAKGESVSRLSERINGVVGDQARALRIARTEAGEAVSAARFLAAKGAGATGKGWIAGRNPRPTHSSAGRDYAPSTAPIPMDQAFDLGGARLMYPRDPAAPVGEKVNCNCSMVTVRLEKAANGQPRYELVNASGGVV